MTMTRYLDPSRRWKLTHAVAGAIITVVYGVWPYVNHGWAATLGFMVLAGTGYEVLETYDAARGAYGPDKLGTPGYGFSWRDVVMDVVGAVVVLAVAAVTR